MTGPAPGSIALPPSTLPLVAPVDEPAGAPLESVRRDAPAQPVQTAAPLPVEPSNGTLRSAPLAAFERAGAGDPVGAAPAGGGADLAVVASATADGPAGPRDVAGSIATVSAGPTRAADGAASDSRLERPPVERSGSCTTAQLRRFIKSRAYVPMHEIRRRFLIVSEDDDVTGLTVDGGRIFVGLPEREGQMLGELFRSGEIGYELQLDPRSPVVVGVYPMRPVSRT